MRTLAEPVHSAYALTNPMSILVGIEDRMIECITFHYTALDGKYKAPNATRI